MLSIERLLYVTLAGIFGIILIGVLATLPLADIGEEVSSGLDEEYAEEFKKVDIEGFYREVLSFWEAHQWDEETANVTLYVQGDRTIDKEAFFSFVKENHLCDSLQSSSFDCGEREDTVIEPVRLPQVVSLRYADETLHISSEGFPRNRRYIHSQMTPLPTYGGAGRIHIQLDSLPSDGRVTSFSLLANIGSDFNISMNGEQCGTFNVDADVQRFNFTRCKAHISNGSNNVTLRFDTDKLQRKHVGGGHFLLLYSSSTPTGSPPSTQRVYLPAINGTIEIFDGVNIPGNPTSVDAHLHYEIDEPENGTFEAIFGGTTEKTHDTAGEYTDTFTIPAGRLYEGPNPFVLAKMSNASREEEIRISNPVDAVLITDESGSMKGSIDGSGSGDTRGGSCTHPDLYDSDTQKLHLAKCSGVNFTEIILDEYKGNRVGLISFSSAVATVLDLTKDFYAAESTLMGYSAGGGTCVYCPIVEARNMLQDSENAKAMVVMTDGNGVDPARTRTEAQQAASEGIEVFSIAFGANADTTLLQDIACYSNCSNYAKGDSASEIADIYEEFGRRIADVTSVTTRYTKVSGASEPLEGRLYNDSYLDISYSPPSGGTDAKFLVTDRIDNPGTFYFPANMTVEMARFLLWPGTQWTDRITVNGNVIFNLSRYSANYSSLGDPSRAHIPPSHLSYSNSVHAMRGHLEEETSSSVEHVRVQYIVTVPPSDFTPGSYENARGCHWTVAGPEGPVEYTLPTSYTGSSMCRYNVTSTYDPDDMYQDAAAYLFRDLDIDDDGVLETAPESIHALGGLP